MKTTRVILKVPFYKHAAGSVFDLREQTEPAEWPEDERLREKQNFSAHQVYILPDNGRGLAVKLPLHDTMPCPEHVFNGADHRKNGCRITLVQTQHSDPEIAAAGPAPCGQLREEHVTTQRSEVLQSQVFLIDLPPFEEIAEKMLLWDRLEERVVLEYALRNYSHSDTQLKWDVSDLHPGFYELRICFPGNWFHAIRFIKSFPFVEPDKIPPPKPASQGILDKIWSKFVEPAVVVASEPDLANEALSLCLEWGAMFNQPTQERMMRLHPDLSQAEADELDRQAREVRSFVYDLCEQECRGEVEESKLHLLVRRKYPWVSDTNFFRMKNVGMYYARR